MKPKIDNVRNLSSLSEDLEIIRKAMFDRNDSECAIIGASYIDKCLSNIIFNRLRSIGEEFLLKQLFDYEHGAFSTYSSRNKIVHSLKIIDDRTKNDIRSIGYIRNRFAHDYLAITFSDEEIKRYCCELKLWEKHFYPTKVKRYNLEKHNGESELLKEIFVYSAFNSMQTLLTKGHLKKILYSDYY